jgi:hypothetical protein
MAASQPHLHTLPPRSLLVSFICNQRQTVITCVICYVTCYVTRVGQRVPLAGHLQAADLGAPGPCGHPPWVHTPAINTRERCRRSSPFADSCCCATADSITLGSPVGAVTLWVLPSM